MNIEFFKNINFRLLLFYFLTAICAAISIEIITIQHNAKRNICIYISSQKIQKPVRCVYAHASFFSHEQTEMDNFHFIISLGYILFISNMVFQDISDSNALFILFFIR